jgi:lysophospholipid acyltransferase (LPLAT)-like uncharacterized protein
LARFLKKYVFSFLIWFLYKLLSSTWRVKFFEPESMRALRKSRQPMILAHWHGDELVLISAISRYRIATLSSKSDDGEMMSVIIKLLGGKTSRGSSSKSGATGLLGLLRMAKKGYNFSFAVDGPKGPLHVVKPGVFEFSRLANSPIFVGGVSCDRSWLFKKSWNQAFLPKPFAKIKIVWREFMGPVSKELDPRSEQLRNHMADALRKVHSHASQKNCGV